MKYGVHGAVLKWAREEAGFEVPIDVAGALGISVEELAAFEDDTASPTLTILRKMAVKYKRPLYALGMPDRPAPAPKPEDFRTVAGTAPRLSAKALLAIRLTRERQRYASALDEAAHTESARRAIPQVSLEADPAKVASELRARLGITVDEQLAWPSAVHALRAWRWRVEDLGALVFSAPVPRDDFRGFSWWPSDDSRPAILVNSAETEEAKAFTLFHECAHLALRRGGICQERESGIDKAKVERFANRLAASLLIPHDALFSVVKEVVGRVDRDRWNDAELSTLARQFKVSPLAMGLRLEELGLAPPGFFDELSERRRGQEWVKRRFGRAKYHEKRLTQLGSRYSSLILDAHSKGIVTTIDAYGMLNLPAKYFGSLRDTLSARARLFGKQ